jgi:sodium-coupled neutral amino acid transporter 11
MRVAMRALLAAGLLAQSVAFALTPPRGGAVGLVPIGKPALPSAERPGRPLRLGSPALSEAVLAAQAPEPKGAAVLPSVINLAKNIVGSGVLALAAGVAAVSSNRVALIPAIILTILLGAISA